MCRSPTAFKFIKQGCTDLQEEINKATPVVGDSHLTSLIDGFNRQQIGKDAVETNKTIH